MGQDKTGRGRYGMGQDKTGQDRTRQDRTGQDRTGQDRTGQDWTGQDRTGQDRTGQSEGTEQDRTGHGRAGPDINKKLTLVDSDSSIHTYLGYLRALWARHGEPRLRIELQAALLRYHGEVRAGEAQHQRRPLSLVKDRHVDFLRLENRFSVRVQHKLQRWEVPARVWGPPKAGSRLFL